MMDLLITRISLLCTMSPHREGLGQLSNAAVAFKNGSVAYVGDSANAPNAKTVIDGSGYLGMPGLVDPHTHAVWAGSRSKEFAQRLAGANYTDILNAGGGILSTVRHTRQATTDQLRNLCRQRLAGMLARGVTTVEIKSGYGLSPEAELKSLKAAHATEDMRITRTFLGAHAIPKDYRSKRDAYVDQIITKQLPLCAPFADSIDVYCDKGAFDLDEAIAILQAGKEQGLKIRAHAEQVAHTGISGAAAKMGATCVDHLEQVSEEDISDIADNKAVAVLLPGAQFYLKDTAPPVAALREAGILMAVGTDLNPGSSPVHDIWTAATMACVMQGLSIEEALLGITRHGGMALGMNDVGWIGNGSAGDLCLLRPPAGEPIQPESLIQHMGHPGACLTIKAGQIVYNRMNT